MSEVVTLKEQSFLDDRIDLKKLRTDLSKHTKAALDVLVACLSSKDEKVRFTAACKLLDMQVAVAKEINEDQFKRLIAEVKLARGPKALLPDGSGGSGAEAASGPIVDFSTIREIQ